jgi:hypothetical protein
VRVQRRFPGSRPGTGVTHPATAAPYIHLRAGSPAPARRVVESLSTPELLHILKRWQILHPSSVPLSMVERADLVELAVQNEVASQDLLSACASCELPLCSCGSTCIVPLKRTVPLQGPLSDIVRVPVRAREFKTGRSKSVRLRPSMAILSLLWNLLAQVHLRKPADKSFLRLHVPI